ncbi:hypothetical protein [Bacillus pumilus]|nr:hypothetical protein [Bacillus pumilus]
MVKGFVVEGICGSFDVEVGVEWFLGVVGEEMEDDMEVVEFFVSVDL